MSFALFEGLGKKVDPIALAQERFALTILPPPPQPNSPEWVRLAAKDNDASMNLRRLIRVVTETTPFLEP